MKLNSRVHTGYAFVTSLMTSVGAAVFCCRAMSEGATEVVRVIVKAMLLAPSMAAFFLVLPSLVLKMWRGERVWLHLLAMVFIGLLAFAVKIFYVI